MEEISLKMISIIIVIFTPLLAISLSFETDAQETQLLELDILPNIYEKEKLMGLDSKGDNLHLTIIFKKEQGQEEVRRINYYIVEEHVANNFNVYTLDVLQDKALDMEIGLRERIEKDVVNTKNSQMYLVISNPLMEGDNEDIENATARIRLEYTVTEEQEEGGIELIGIDFSTGGLLFLVIDVIVIISVIIFTIIALSTMKKRGRDSNNFFSSAGIVYYVFRGPEGTIYYFSKRQYEDMYKSGNLGGYVYLGESSRIGGDIESPAPVQTQITPAEPISEEYNVADMKATAVDMESYQSDETSEP